MTRGAYRERIPADGVLIDSLNLQVDESLLTGESVPVRKQAVEAVAMQGAPASGSDDAYQSEHAPTPGGDDTPYVFSGCLVVQGNGVARITAIGASTEIGRIGKALNEQEQEPGKLNVELNKWSSAWRWAGWDCVRYWWCITTRAVCCTVLAGLTWPWVSCPKNSRHRPFSWHWEPGASQATRMARRPAVIETLGSATVLCTDKTEPDPKPHV